MGAYGSPELHPALRDSEYDRLQQLKWKYCEKCGHKFLETEKACPKCGYKPKPKRSGWTVFWAATAVIEAGLIFLPYISNSYSGSIPPPPKVKTYTQAEVDAMIEAREEEIALELAEDIVAIYGSIGSTLLESLFPSLYDTTPETTAAKKQEQTTAADNLTYNLIYEDSNVTVYFVSNTADRSSSSYSNYYSVTLFVTNKTENVFYLDPEAIIIDGISYGTFSGSESIAAKSSGFVTFKETIDKSSVAMTYFPEKRATSAGGRFDMINPNTYRTLFSISIPDTKFD